MLHFHKTLDTLCSQTNWEFMMEDRWKTRTQRSHNFHSACIDTLNPSFAEFSLPYFSRVWRFGLVQDDRTSHLLWHEKASDHLPKQQGDGWQDAGVYEGADQAQQRGFSLVLAEGMETTGSLGAHVTAWCLLIQTASHFSPQLSSLSSLPQVKSGLTVTPNPERSRPGSPTDCAEPDASFPTTAADS